MKLLRNLFGNADLVEDVVKGSIEGIDAAFYTDEEKGRAAQQMLEFRLRYMEATHPQNVARRVIAIMVIGLWVFLVLVATLSQPASIAFSDHVFKVLDEVVNPPSTIIFGFYYLAHVVRAARK